MRLFSPWREWCGLSLCCSSEGSKFLIVFCWVFFVWSWAASHFFVAALFYKFLHCVNTSVGVCVWVCWFEFLLRFFLELLKLWQLRQLNQRGNYCAIKLETSSFYKLLTVWVMIHHEPQKDSSIYSNTVLIHHKCLKKSVSQLKFPFKVVQICIWIKSHTWINPLLLPHQVIQ